MDVFLEPFPKAALGWCIFPHLGTNRTMSVPNCLEDKTKQLDVILYCKLVICFEMKFVDSVRAFSCMTGVCVT